VRIALDGGWFRAWVLYLDGVPCAFELGHRCSETFIVAAKGFDPDYGHQNVGKVVQLKMLEDLVADPGVDVVDFGFGDADYKRHFGDESWVEEDVVVFEPRARPVALNLAGTALQGTTAAARAALEKVGGLARLRQRRRAQAGSRS
jgi:CelD/BcsL family acetyltransferase involved in cellulose biosynthesis